VKDALGHTRPSGDGVVDLALPATPEQILKVLTRHAAAAKLTVPAAK
jgi:hypothetical protein